MRGIIDVDHRRRHALTAMPSVTLYTRVNCHLCDVVKAVLDAARAERAFALEVVDVDSDAALRARYGLEVPVVLIDGRKAFKYRVDPLALRRKLDRAEAGDPLPAIDAGDGEGAR
jgi:glutaredoxin